MRACGCGFLRVFCCLAVLTVACPFLSGDASARDHDPDDVRVEGLTHSESLRKLLEDNAGLRQENTRLRKEINESELRLEAYAARIQTFTRSFEGLRAENRELTGQLERLSQLYGRRLEEAQEQKEQLSAELASLQEERESDTYVQKWEQASRELKMAEEAVAVLAREKRAIQERTGKMHYNLGSLFFQKGEYERSAIEFEAALGSLPEDPDVRYNLAILYDHYLDDPGKAVEHYRAYLAKSPSPRRELDVRERISVNILRARARPIVH